ncbi:uncharacterized protein TNCV_1260551 [Trichonephila clavipes]|nr:uncharacterized protein TNCV_1260551 [Trichonephila clavipes]
MANNQSVRRHLDAFTRGRIIGKLEEGRSVTSVAAEFGIAHIIVSRLWRQFQTTGTAIRGFSSGRPRGTTPTDDRYIVLQARRSRRQTAGAMGLQFLFMDDNAQCHRTVAAEMLLESEDIERMDWPARSPDLNPIEHVWDFLDRRLAARTLPPVTIREFRLALQDEWAAMPQQLIDTLILSMGRRHGAFFEQVSEFTPRRIADYSDCRLSFREIDQPVGLIYWISLSYPSSTHCRHIKQPVPRLVRYPIRSALAISRIPTR